MGIPTHVVFAVRKNARIFALVLTCAALVGTLAVVATYRSTMEKNQTSGAPQLKAFSLSPELIAEVTRDGDADGLKDWEEAVWHTDAKQADTDGDGTSDGDEVSQNRDPKKPGPDDRYVYAADTPAAEATSEAGQNLTARFGAGIAVDIAGASSNESKLKAIASAYAENMGTVAVLDGARRYTTRDLTPSRENDLLAVMKFFAAIEEVWQRRFGTDGQSDLAAFFSAFETEDDGTAVNSILEGYARAYQAAIDTVLTTPTPKELEPFAVGFLNYLSRVHRSVLLMQNFTSDPLAAMLAVRERLALNEEFGAFMTAAAADSREIVQKKLAELVAQQKK